MYVLTNNINISTTRLGDAAQNWLKITFPAYAIIIFPRAVPPRKLVTPWLNVDFS